MVLVSATLELLAANWEEIFSIFMVPCVGTKKAMGINKPTAPKIVEAVGRSWVCPWPQSKYDYFRRRRADPVLKPKKQKLRK